MRKGNYKMKTDKNGKVIAFKWSNKAMRWIRVSVSEAKSEFLV